VIVDSSVLVAILLREPGHEDLLDALLAAPRVGVGAATLVETGMVLVSRRERTGRTLLARFVADAGLEVIDLTADHWGVAVDAFARYGKGRHPAKLNFGDCLTYAVAHVADRPLLCVGDDFRRTDAVLA